MNATCDPLPAELTRAQALQRLIGMLLIRRFEEKAAEMYTLGRIEGFLHLAIGEEAVAVGMMQAVTPEDNIVSTYREHGHALARGISPGAVMAEMFGKVSGCSRGRGGSMHLFDAGLRFYGGHAIVGSHLPTAVGLALAARLQKQARVTVCIFGDGAVAEGEFHESLNLAGLWHLPILFLCENNLYAMGTHLTRHQARINIADKASSYGLTGVVVDGMDVLAVEAATRQAVESIRAGGDPVLLEARTYRFRAHSMYDAELYRARQEVEEWKQRDPVTTYAARLRAGGLLDDSLLAELEGNAASAVAAAVAFAEAAEREPVEDLLKDVYTPVTP